MCGTETYRRRTLVVHGVNDWAHGEPFELSAEQGVINDVEQHSCNGTIQDLFHRQMG